MSKYNFKKYKRFEKIKKSIFSKTSVSKLSALYDDVRGPPLAGLKF